MENSEIIEALREISTKLARLEALSESNHARTESHEAQLADLIKAINDLTTRLDLQAKDVRQAIDVSRKAIELLTGNGKPGLAERLRAQESLCQSQVQPELAKIPQMSQDLDAVKKSYQTMKKVAIWVLSALATPTLYEMGKYIAHSLFH